MNGLRLAAIMLFGYALLLIGNGFMFYSDTDNTNEVVELVIRLAAVLLISLGLWNSKRWAWQLGTVISILFGIAGVISVATVFMTDFLEDRPYRALESFNLTASVALLVGAAIVLLLPNTRRNIKN